MLPPWINDFATVITLVTGVPMIVGSVLGWLLRGRGPIEPPSPQILSRQSITFLGLFKTGAFNEIVRPGVPVSQDALKAVLMAALLAGVTCFYLWIGGDNPYELPIMPILGLILFYSILLVAILLGFMWALLVWKIGYMNRMHDCSG